MSAAASYNHFHHIEHAGKSIYKDDNVWMKASIHYNFIDLLLVHLQYRLRLIMLLKK